MSKLELGVKVAACVVGCGAAVLLAAGFLTELTETLEGMRDSLALDEEFADYDD